MIRPILSKLGSSVCNNTQPCNYNTNRCTMNKRCSKTYRSSNCFRPLQHLYKTTYQNNHVRVRHPSERYKTTNMTYGSFHYNNWAFIQKNRSVKYSKELSVRCNKQPCSSNTSDKLNHVHC
ncbi:hypothetical protein I4U23_013820 [Adineta vaga]|nr:hypothetical protein I4U23_013820 [Adineta vaga]